MLKVKVVILIGEDSMKTKKNSYRDSIKFGYSIVEMLVVIAIFSILAVLSTQSIATSLRGSKKSENSISIRQNLDYVTSVMDRQLRNAKSIGPTACWHPSANSTQIDYVDSDNQPQSFICDVSGSVGFVSSSAIGMLTPPEVNITSCTTAFACNLGVPGSEPPTVSVTLTGTNTNATGADATTVTTTARILLRTYSVY